MSVVLEKFIKGSDNEITLNLLEADSPVMLSWTSLTIQVGSFSITRSGNGNGVDFTDGVLTITPGDLTEDVSALANVRHRVYVDVISPSTPNSVVFGADDSESALYFSVSSP